MIELRAAQAKRGIDRFVRRARFRGGTLAYSAQTIAVGGSAGSRVRKMLVVCDEEGREQACIHAAETAEVMGSRRWVEKEEYFIHGRWDLGPDGTLFLAPDCDACVIEVYQSDGTHVPTVTRDFQPRCRSAEEKAGKGVKVNSNGRDLETDSVIADHAPCIDEVQVGSDGTLWVRHAWSRVDQPAGVLETWDLFDAEGRFRRQVSLAVDAHPGGDQLLRVGERRFVLIKRFEERILIRVGGDAEGVEEGTPLSR